MKKLALLVPFLNTDYCMEIVTGVAEYFKDKSIYEDYDGILDYIKRFVFRPLKNLLTGTREFDKEFNIKGNE